MMDFKENERVHLTVLAIDLTGSTKLWEKLPEERVKGLIDRYRDAVDPLIEQMGGTVYLKKTIWQGDGIFGYFFKPQASSELDKKVISLGIQIWQILKYEHNLNIKMSATSTEITYSSIYKEDPGRITSKDLNHLGHIIKSCPPDLFLITENIYWSLKEKEEFTYFGTTRRDEIMVYAYPSKTKERPNKDYFLKEDEDTNRIKDTYIRYLQDEHGFFRYTYQQEKIVTLKMDEVFTPLILQERGYVIEKGFIRERDTEPISRDKDPDKISLPDEDSYIMHRPIQQPPEAFEDVFINKKYIAIIGDPGSGKSTLLRWLAFIYSQGRHSVSRKLEGLNDKDLTLFPIIAGIGGLYGICKEEKKTIISALERYYEKKQLPGTERLFEKKLKDGEALILLDGLDEVSLKDKTEVKGMIEDFIRRYPDNRFIITSREAGYSELIFPSGITSTYTILPLTEEQIERLVGGFFVAFEKQQIERENSIYCQSVGEENAVKFLSTIKEEPHLLALSKNPLLLSLLCLSHRQGRTLLKYWVKVYELIAQILTDTWSEVRSLSRIPLPKGDFYIEAASILNPIGLWLHSDERYYSTGLVPRKELEDKIIELMKRMGKKEEEAKEHAKNFLDRLADPRTTHILCERGTGLFGFIHLTFREFFAASAIISGDEEEKYLKEYAYYSNWREVIKLMFGILGIMQGRTSKVSQLLNSILSGFGDSLNEEILKKNILLSAEIAGELPQLPRDIEEEIASKFFPLIYSEFDLLRQDTHRILKSMKETGIGMTIKGELVKRAKEDIFDRKTLEALGSLGIKDERVLNSLIKALEDKDLGVREEAAWALGRLGIKDEKVLNSLIKALEDKDYLVRGYAASALACLGIKDERVLNSLIKALEDENVWIRINAASALGSLGIKGERVLNILIKALEDEDYRVRANAASFLERLGIKDERVIDSLIKALEDKDFRVRIYAASALGGLGIKDERVLNSLIKALEDKDSLVREYAASALGSLGIKGERVLNILIKALEDEDYRVRANAASFLERLGIKDERVIDSLIKALADENSEVRINAASTLGSLGIKDEGVVDSLIKALEDKNSWVRKNAVSALSNLLSPTKAQSMLSHFIESYNKTTKKDGYFHLLWKFS